MNTLKGGRSTKDQRVAENKIAGKYSKQKQLVVSNRSKKRAIRKKIVSWVTGVLGANMDNYKHGNLALLQSFAKGIKQNPHTNSAAINEYCGDLVQAGRLLFRPCRTPNTQTLEFEPIKVPKGKCIVFCRDKQKKKNRYKPHFFMFTIRVLMLFLCYMYLMLCPCCLHFPLSIGILLPLQVQYIKMNKNE